MRRPRNEDEEVDSSGHWHHRAVCALCECCALLKPLHAEPTGGDVDAGAFARAGQRFRTFLLPLSLICCASVGSGEASKSGEESSNESD